MKQQKEYYSITNRLYGMKDADHFDYAVMSTISTLNYPFVADEKEKVTEIKIKPFKVSDIYNALNISNRNRNRKTIQTKIEKSIVKLIEENIIKIDEVIKSDSRESTFVAKQIVDTKGGYSGFASITSDEYFKIVLNIEKDGEKIKALACYISIVQRIFKTDKRELYNKDKLNISNLSYYINWESQESIGNKYGMSRRSVSKSIELLVEVEAIVFKEMKQRGSGKEIKYIYAKYCNKDKLDMYVKEQLNNKVYIERINDYAMGAIDLKSELFSK